MIEAVEISLNAGSSLLDPWIVHEVGNRGLRRDTETNQWAVLSEDHIRTYRWCNSARMGWRQSCQTVGLLDARAHLSLMPSVRAPGCNTPDRRKELAAGVPSQR